MADPGKKPFRDTSLGGKGRFFPQTTWNLVTRLGAGTEEGRRAGLESLCDAYWKPVYCYVRTAWAKKNEEAKDLTQAFFLWLIEGDALARYEPGRGGFRSYLKSLLRHFEAHREEARRRLKRGGGVRIHSLQDEAERPYEEVIADPNAGDPETVFDRTWKEEVVRKAMARVRKECEAKGKGVVFRVFEEHDLATPADRPTYEQLAAKLDLSSRQVKRYLVSIRERIRLGIRQEILDLVADEGELESEWNELIGD
ncbi:MAG: RNA polymerase sigma factor [Planctomycetota bacterium]|jgi:RNA polymerase sigma-70 factor (ECF subfamily)